MLLQHSFVFVGVAAGCIDRRRSGDNFDSRSFVLGASQHRCNFVDTEVADIVLEGVGKEAQRASLEHAHSFEGRVRNSRALFQGAQSDHTRYTGDCRLVELEEIPEGLTSKCPSLLSGIFKKIFFGFFGFGVSFLCGLGVVWVGGWGLGVVLVWFWCGFGVVLVWCVGLTPC